MKVRATKKYEKYIDTLVDRPRREGEVFEVHREVAMNLEEQGLVVILEKEHNASAEKRMRNKVAKRKR